MLILRSREELEHQIITLHAEGVTIRALYEAVCHGQEHDPSNPA